MYRRRFERLAVRVRGARIVPLLSLFLLIAAPAIAGSPVVIPSLAHASAAGACVHDCGARPVPASSATTWYNVTGRTTFHPPPRSGASEAFDPADDYIVLFGGCSMNACPAPSVTWEFSGGSWTNITASGPQPPARSGASLVWDTHDNYLLLFGGWAGPGHYLNDTWSFAGGVWTNQTPNVTGAPSPRAGAAMAYDHLDAYTVLFGGCGVSNCALNDTYRYASGVWTLVAGTTDPPGRSYAAFAWDDAAGFAFLAFGCGASGPINDTWTFVHGRWSTISPTGPSPTPRCNAASGYSSFNQGVILFGGNVSATLLSDTWMFAAGAWANLTPTALTPPSVREGAAFPASTIAWTGGASKKWPYLILFGGTTDVPPPPVGAALSDTWILEPTLSVIPTGVPSAPELWEPVSFQAVAQGGAPPFFYRWILGDGTVVTTANATHAFAHVGNYTATVNVSDSAGVLTRGTLHVNVVVGPAPTASASPSTTDTGLTVTFTASASGGTAPYVYRWGFGDGASGTGTPAHHAYSVPGSYTPNLTATDNVAGAGVTTTHVHVNPFPSVSIAVASQVVIGNSATFSAHIVGGTAPFMASWTFGDSHVGGGVNTTHAYAAIGAYPVQVILTDAAGAVINGSATVRVVGVPPPIQKSNPTSPFVGSLEFDSLVIAAIIASAALVVVAAILYRRRRLDRTTPAPIATAAAGQPDWFEGSNANSNDSRSARRARRPRF